MLTEELKLRTADHHQRTENAFDLKAACQSKETYAALLRKMASLYQPLEARLDKFNWPQTRIDDWPARRKLELIRRDLMALNMSTEVADAPAAATLPLNTPAAVIGCLYVLEGSTLGGQFIRKHVKRTLGLDVETGCAFFIAYGEKTQEMWASFKAAANAFGAAHADQIDAACESAIATFTCFEKTLSKSA